MTRSECNNLIHGSISSFFIGKRKKTKMKELRIKKNITQTQNGNVIKQCKIFRMFKLDSSNLQPSHSRSCKIHQLHLCREVKPPPNECPGYDTEISDDEAPGVL